MGQYSYSDTFSDVITVSKNGNALTFNGTTHTYQSAADTVFYCSFTWEGSSTNYSSLSFGKTNDSIFYSTRSGGLGGGRSEFGRGKKIH
jgi:hypothetical protein